MPLPHEPVSYERVWADGCAEGPRPWTEGGFMEGVAMTCVWEARGTYLQATTHVRLANGQLVIVRPKTGDRDD